MVQDIIAFEDELKSLVEKHLLKNKNECNIELYTNVCSDVYNDVIGSEEGDIDDGLCVFQYPVKEVEKGIRGTQGSPAGITGSQGTSSFGHGHMHQHNITSDTLKINGSFTNWINKNGTK